MSSGLPETSTEVAYFVSLIARFWFRYQAVSISTAFAWRIELLMKVNNCSSSSGRMWVGIE